MRTLSGIHKYIVNGIAILASLYHLYTATFGVYTPRLQRSYHLILLLPLVFLLYPATKNSPKDKPTVVDYILSFLILLPNLYIILNNSRIEARWEFVSKVTSVEVIMATTLVILIIEIIRRAVAPVLSALASVSLLYLLFGQHLPQMIAHNGFPFSRCAELLYLINDEGIYGMMTGISATYVAIFIVFGAFLVTTGISNFFSDFSRAFAGSSRGGPAKIAVISSALFGTVSGVAVANVFATGSFTIPLMKKRGYMPTFAAAVEAAASTGGQIMPPVMGAAAFVMAEMLSIPYIKICLYAAISAVLYFFSIFYTVDIAAKRFNLQGEDKKDLPKKSEVFKKIYLFSPILVLLYLLVTGYSPIYAAAYCIYFCVIIAVINPEVRKDLVNAFGNALIDGGKNAAMLAGALAGTGIIVAVITHTGLGLKFSRLIIYMAQGKLILTLLFVALGAIILGTGVPSTAAYILSVVLGGRALIELGVTPLAAHLFCFYFAIIACVTPPVALCAYAGASIADCDPIKTGWEAFKLAIAGFIVPFIFVYNNALLAIGSLFEIITTTLVATLIVILSCSIAQSYFHDSYVNIAGRALLTVSALFIAYNSLVLTYIGYGLFVVFMLGRKRYFSKRILPIPKTSDS